ncbi:Sir2 family NAD-dependent protein deacetylase [Microbacterium saperdae]|uniref:protein acetyllysine N-acetyltransferase n=1 Tax=Microbacterium saperdae TaxID=69368 RepID=A0A543BMW5_9MICO|nr:Sir2 family NAD-dependent protein deacetylase [Microbacterium saperdae]TQL86175.1 NAD-dependent SIR2 family protein deacetylase [Microbacterium saperdae]GGM50073.1 NAD-dependent protein deacetylase [Microbacterium saperdae]
MSVSNPAELSATIAHAADLLRGKRIALLTGAGISTDSGIPAYRGEGARNRSDPMTIQTYLGDAAARRRYWIGGHLGWKAFAQAGPNPGHTALAEMEASGLVSGVITQNVDGLHLRAGSSHVIEVHGTMRRVLCLHCGQVFDRRDVAVQIEQLNPWITVPENVALAPDGDVLPESTEGFVVPVCTVCDGMLKPDVVFFGEYVPQDRFRAAESLLRASSALIVAGSSLVVNSGVRLVERARRRSIPLIIVNHEPTRADVWADVTIAAGTSEVLPALQELLR